MGFLSKLFGGGKDQGSGTSVESAVDGLIGLYDQADVKAEGGLSITGPHANEVRTIGRNLHKSGGKPAMEAALAGLRERVPWAGKNVEAIWASLPQWRGE
jgi:hypothetical protein